MPENNKVELIWAVAAVQDIIRLRSFIEPHNKKSAIAAADTIKKAALMLVDYPAIGKPVENTQERELAIMFGRRGYVMRYRLQKNMAVVLRIWHGFEEKLD